MAEADGGNFNVQTLTRTDSLYFTVTVFASVIGKVADRAQPTLRRVLD